MTSTIFLKFLSFTKKEKSHQIHKHTNTHTLITHTITHSKCAHEQTVKWLFIFSSLKALLLQKLWFQMNIYKRKINTKLKTKAVFCCCYHLEKLLNIPFAIESLFIINRNRKLCAIHSNVSIYCNDVRISSMFLNNLLFGKVNCIFVKFIIYWIPLGVL